MAGAAGKQEDHTVVVPDVRVDLGNNLWLETVVLADLREQDVNAHLMSKVVFERLVENIRRRGQMESIPFCAQPGGVGPIEIVSGHHRVRAAREAGIEKAVVLVDRNTLTRSQMVAKQLAHNALVGTDDAETLRRLVAQITSVDDLLESGLDESFLPTPDEFGVNLFTPVADFRWKTVTFTFLDHQAENLKELCQAIKTSDVLGVAAEDQWEPFLKAVADYARAKSILSVHMAVALLIQQATKALPAEAQKEAAQ